MSRTEEERDKVLYEAEQRYTNVDLTKPIHRGIFLQARMAYLAHMASENLTQAQMRSAANIDDDIQVDLLIQTWKDSRAREQRMLDTEEMCESCEDNDET